MNTKGTADIFLSYNREDQAVARRFATAFEREGFTVWWDTQLRSGEPYDEVTEGALKAARAVVVLWSKRSVVSRWVRAEATLAERHHTLVPAMIEPCERPIMFELAQTADLSHWQGEPADNAWLAFLADVRRRIESGPAAGAAPGPPKVAAGRLNPPLGQALPRLHTTHAVPTNLTAQSTAIIGRDRDVVDIEALLIESRVVTLTGPGGVGKSRICVEVGRRIAASGETALTSAYLRQKFTAGVWLVELAALTDQQLIASTIARALEITLADGAAPERALARRLQHADLLILLDNCEHLIDAAASFVESLLSHCPGVQVLATSQEPLRIQGETVFHLLPLALPADDAIAAAQALAAPAVALFVARARAADSRFTLRDEEAPVASAICRRLDGLPLAIEMAAARVATLGLATLADNLDERFRILTGGRRTALPRHQTLRATLEWSHGLLDPLQQSVFRRLGVFPATFTMEAAAAVCAGETLAGWAATEAVEHLVNRSLLSSDPADLPLRFHFMETTREFARAKLREAQEDAESSRRHVAYVLQRLEKCYQESAVLGDAALRRAYGHELENVRTALDWSFSPNGDVVAGFAILGASEPLFLVLSLIGECRTRIEAALPRLGAVGSVQIRARVWASLGRAHGFSNPSRAFECLMNSLPVYRDGDPQTLGGLLVYMGRIAQVLAGRAEEASRLLDEGGPLVERSGSFRLKGHYYRGMGNRLASEGDYAGSVAMMRRACEIFGEGGAASAASTTRTSLGYMLWASGEVDAAIGVCTEVLADIRAFNFPDDGVLGFALGNLAGMRTARGDLGGAATALIEAAPLLLEPWQIWVIFDHIALLAARSGQYASAGLCLGFSDASYQAHGAMRQLNELRANTAARALAEQFLGPAEVTALAAKGADLARGEAMTLAMQVGREAAAHVPDPDSLSAQNSP